MSTSHPFDENRHHLDGSDDVQKSMSPREQILGHIILILLFVLAILLRSM